MRFLLALSALTGLGAQNSPDGTLLFTNTGHSTLGVYWNGNIDIGKELTGRDYLYEKLVDVLKPDYWNTHTAYFGHSFIVRSADMKTRVKIVFEKGTDRNYKLSVLNLSADDNEHAVELKHGKSGFLWIEGTHVVSQDTDEYHTFEIRDAKREPLVSFSVRPYSDKEEM